MEEVRRSRIETTTAMRAAVDRAPQMPEAFVLVTGIGAYPAHAPGRAHEAVECNEHTALGTDALGRLVHDMERAAGLYMAENSWSDEEDLVLAARFEGSMGSARSEGKAVAAKSEGRAGAAKSEGSAVDEQKHSQSKADHQHRTTRVVSLRSGAVLGRDGGAMASLLPAFKMCMGGTMGDGSQYFPWVPVIFLMLILQIFT